MTAPSVEMIESMTCVITVLSLGLYRHTRALAYVHLDCPDLTKKCQTTTPFSKYKYKVRKQ